MEDQMINNELNREFEETKKKADEYLNNWKRERADFLNYKKDEVERAGLLVGYAKEGVLFGILPVLDSIEFARKLMPDSIKHDPWSSGFMQITSQIKDFLKKEGVVEIESVSKPFDPMVMEIVEEVENGEPGIVAEEVQKGYMMGDKLLRPAKVKVVK